MTEDLFVKFWRTVVTDEEEQQDPRVVFRTLIDVKGKGYVTREDLMELTQENLKNLARAMDPPHGPEISSDVQNGQREDDEEQESSDSDQEIERNRKAEL